jgi:hypothetical protein
MHVGGDFDVLFEVVILLMNYQKLNEILILELLDQLLFQSQNI